MTNVATTEPDLEDETDLDEGSEDDDEEVVGWLLISDGEQIVVPHPEGKTQDQVVEEFATARKKQHKAFVLGKYVFDPEVITAFGWSEDIRFPEMEKFDAVQDRLELLMEATGELSRNQAMLQEAQAALFTEEMADMQAEAMEAMAEAQVEAAQQQAAQQQAVAQGAAAAAPPQQPKRKGFRPPA